MWEILVQEAKASKELSVHAACINAPSPLGGATIDPGEGFEGKVWGVDHVNAFAEGGTDASDVREALASVVPQAGEDANKVGDVFVNVHQHCIELMAGRAAERMLLQEGEPSSASDDLRQARELAMLICKSEQAIAAFIAYCDQAAFDLLMPYGDLVIVLSTVLRMARTLDAAEIDRIIWEVEGHKSVAIERHRQAELRSCARPHLSRSAYGKRACSSRCRSKGIARTNTLSWIGWLADVPDLPILSGPT